MTTGKKTAKKAPKKKAVSKKTAVKKAPAKKKTAKKAAAKKTARPTVSQDRFLAMVSEAAYFAAQNDGNRKNSIDYWLEAETAVRANFDIL